MKLLVLLSSFAFYLLCNEIRSSKAYYYSGWYGASYNNNRPNYYDARNHRQLTRNAYVIAELVDRLAKLKTKLGQLESVPSLKKIYSDIAFRVGRLEDLYGDGVRARGGKYGKIQEEATASSCLHVATPMLTGTGCNANQMQCGGKSRQCVSEMLACDGVKDCKNGKDEDPVFCDTSALKPPTAYTATVDLSRCMPGRGHVYNFRTQFRTLHRSKVFPSRLTFTEYVQSYVGSQLVMTTHSTGEFQSGTRRYRAYTPGNIGLWSECFSPEDNTDQFYCHTFKSQRKTDLRVPCVRHFVMNAVKTTKSKLKTSRYRSVRL